MSMDLFWLRMSLNKTRANSYHGTLQSKVGPGDSGDRYSERFWCRTSRVILRNW
jgi:hypothetical protein